MNNLPSVIANVTMNLLYERKALLYDTGKVFWVWKRDDRAVLAFDTAQIDIGKLNDDFTHRLSTRLAGRRVVRTNSRGIFLQVGYDIPPVKTELQSVPLDLSRQPTPFHLPIGTTDKGELWRSLPDAVSVFVVGVSGMGKSALVHACIQALLYGGQTLVYAWDGKDNAEYLRYVGRKNFTLFPMNGLHEGLKALEDVTRDRWRALAKSGYPNIVEYNRNNPQSPMMPLALVIDEVAEVDNQEALVRHVKVNRAAGLFPIFATNDPTKSAVIAKSNLQTRISFSVVSATDSVTGLGRSGAQKLPKVQGRGLIEERGRLVEFQTFRVDYPMPTEEGLRWLEDAMRETESQPTARDEIAELAEGIRGDWSEGMSGSAVARLLGLSQYGGSYKARIDKVVAYLTSTLYSTTPKMPENGGFGAVEG